MEGIGVVRLGSAANTDLGHLAEIVNREATEYASLRDALDDGIRLALVCGNAADVIGELETVPAPRRDQVIAVCCEASPADMLELFELGVHRCILSPHTRESARVPRESEHRALASSWEATVEQVQMDEQDLTIKVCGADICLTLTQFRILKCLVARAGEWVTATQIVTEALGTHHRTDSSIVRVHIHAVRRSLGKWGRLIETSRRRSLGYRFVGTGSRLKRAV